MRDFIIIGAYFSVMPLFWRYYVRSAARKFPNAGWDRTDSFSCIFSGLVWPFAFPVRFIAFMKYWDTPRDGMFGRWFNADVSKQRAARRGVK